MRPQTASSQGDADKEVARINEKERKPRVSRRAKTTQEYYPSTRRSKSMWNEGVEFTSPNPARFQLPSLPSVNDLNSGMRDLEVWPSGNKSFSGVSQRVPVLH